MGGRDHNFDSNHIRPTLGSPSQRADLGLRQTPPAPATTTTNDCDNQAQRRASHLPAQWPFHDVQQQQQQQLIQVPAATGRGQPVKLASFQQQLQQQPPPPPLPTLWSSIGGRCSTFAAADVRRALQATASLAPPPAPGQLAVASNAETRRLGGSGQRQTSGPSCTSVNVDAGAAAAAAAADPQDHHLNARPAAGEDDELSSGPARGTKSAQVDDERLRRRRRQLSASCVWSAVGVRTRQISSSSSSNQRQPADDTSARHTTLEASEHKTADQQEQAQAQAAAATTKTKMQSIRSLSMQLERSHQPQVSQHHSSSNSNNQNYHQVNNNHPHHHHQRHQRAATMDNGQQQQAAQAAPAAPANKFGRLVGKKAARVKELLLQNLGRAERTSDELFDAYEENFFKQQQQASKLAKEFKAYLQALRQFQEAGRSLNRCVQQSTSDYQPARHDLVCEQLAHLDQLNEELVERLRDQVLGHLGDYLAQFGELKDKIAKRHRKLIDFDSSRRAFELTYNQVQKRRQRAAQQQSLAASDDCHLQATGSSSSAAAASQLARGLKFLSQSESSGDLSAASQLVDEARLLKLREQFNYCKLMYETINSELHDELPVVYERKMKSLLATLQNYFALEAHYHSNAGKLLATASDVIDELPELQHPLGVLQAAGARHRDSLGGHQTTAATTAAAATAAMATTELTKGPAGELYELAGPEGPEVAADEAHGHLEHHLEHHHRHQATGDSSGVGSSRADSSSCPDSSTSASSSPDSAARQASASGLGQHVSEADDDQFGQLEPGVGQREMQEEEDQDEDVDDDDDDERQVDVASGKAGEPPLALAAATASADDTSACVYVDAGARAGEEPTTEVGLAPGLAAASQVEVAPVAGEAVAAGAVDAGDKGLAALAELANVDSQLEDPAEGHKQPQQHLVVPAKVCKTTTDDDDDDVEQEQEDDEDREQQQQVVVGVAEDSNGEPAVCLYKVRTSYKYLAEDVDELCFEADEIIQVIEFDESHEPEDGWLLGIREVNGQRGLFPANFTRPI